MRSVLNLLRVIIAITMTFAGWFFMTGVERLPSPLRLEIHSLGVAVHRDSSDEEAKTKLRYAESLRGKLHQRSVWDSRQSLLASAVCAASCASALLAAWRVKYLMSQFDFDELLKK